MGSQNFRAQPWSFGRAKITATDVALFLKGYMSKQKAWGVKVIVEDFLASLAQRLGLSGPRHVCIKTSRYFPGALLKMFGVTSKLEKTMKDDFQNELEKTTREELRVVSEKELETVPKV